MPDVWKSMGQWSFTAPITIFSWQDFLWALPSTCPVSGDVLLSSCALHVLRRMQLWQHY